MGQHEEAEGDRPEGDAHHREHDRAVGNPGEKPDAGDAVTKRNEQPEQHQQIDATTGVSGSATLSSHNAT